jgi:hypothetical protein
MAQGDFIPSIRDAGGRKGILLPLSFHRELDLFDSWQSINRGDGFSYRRVFHEHRNRAFEDDVVQSPNEPVCVPYGGSEGYSPACSKATSTSPRLQAVASGCSRKRRETAVG